MKKILALICLAIIVSQGAVYSAAIEKVTESEEYVQVNVVPVSDNVSESKGVFAEKPAVNKTKKSDFANTDWEE